MITDLAFNPLEHQAQANFLGWSSSFAEYDEREAIMDLDIYRFLIKPIRDADQQDGAEFIYRYLRGAQSVWEQTQNSLAQIANLWSIVDIGDAYLPYLKNILGWTSVLSHITEPLSALQLRRLLNASIPLWSRRGAEDALVDVLHLTSGARVRSYNWFDRRMILDAIELGELHEGVDPWLTALPGYPENDEYKMAVRIVDDGALNRALVRGLIILMRPSLERVWIYYLLFLDQFSLNEDDSQWDYPGSERLAVANGIASLDDNSVEEQAFVDVTDSDTWSNYILTARVKGTTTAPGDTFSVAAYYSDANNHYLASVDVMNNELNLYKVVSGTPSLLGTHDFSTEMQTLHDDVWYTLRVHLFDESSSTRIQVHVDGDQKINVLDATFTTGGPAVMHSSGATIDCDLIEIMGAPVDRDLVDINQDR